MKCIEAPLNEDENKLLPTLIDFELVQALMGVDGSEYEYQRLVNSRQLSLSFDLRMRVNRHNYRTNSRFSTPISV